MLQVAEVSEPQSNLHYIDMTNARPTNQSTQIAHPNASKYYDNLTLGDLIIKKNQL